MLWEGILLQGRENVKSWETDRGRFKTEMWARLGYREWRASLSYTEGKKQQEDTPYGVVYAVREGTTRATRRPI